MPVAAWETSWTRTLDTWVDYENSLRQVFDTFKNIEHEVLKFRDYAQQFNKLNDIPWMEIAREIADGVRRQDTRLESADDIMSIADFREDPRGS